MPATSYKIEFCGVRTFPATVGFFDSPPISVSKIKSTRGRFDVCHHGQYPEPGETTPMLIDVVTVDVIPFEVLAGRTSYAYVAEDYWNHPTSGAAWAAMLLNPLREEFDPSVYGYVLEYSAYCNEFPGFGWNALNVTSRSILAVPPGLILPEWLLADDILFAVATAPQVVPYGEGFINMEIADHVIPCNGEFSVIPLDKASFYGDHCVLTARTLPRQCTHGQAGSLDPDPPPGVYGGVVTVPLVFVVYLAVVRRIGCPYIVVTAEQQAKYTYVGLLDGPDGDFIGPAVPIDKLG